MLIVILVFVIKKGLKLIFINFLQIQPTFKLVSHQFCTSLIKHYNLFIETSIFCQILLVSTILRTIK